MYLLVEDMRSRGFEVRRLAVLATLVLGCGDNIRPPTFIGDDADASVPDAPEVVDLAAMCGAMPETVEEWERCYLKRYCETIVHCVEDNLYSNAQECIDLVDAVSGGMLSFEAHERERSIAAGRASLDRAAFTQCLVELSPKRCATAWTAPACATRYAGTIPDNQSCYSDAECVSPGARCESQICSDSCCLGTCKARPKLGYPCGGFVECEPGLVCGLTSHTCVTGDVNTPCGDPFGGCDAGAWCDAGICKVDRVEGDPCDSLLQCGGETSCVGLRREIEPARCRRVTEIGDTCDWYCLGNLYCDLSNPQGFGVCRELPKHGEGCGLFTPCVGQNERCERGLCVARAAVNQPCSDGDCLPGLFCTDQLGATNPVCRDRMTDGELGCNQPAQCQSYICDGSQSASGECQPLQTTCP